MQRMINTSSRVTVAVCSYNSATTLTGLVQALQNQSCSIPVEILVVDNNSTDETRQLVNDLSAREGASLRYVFESNQGIPYARNRAIEESLESDYLAFIDADEMPEPGWLAAAVDALLNEDAVCVGGKIHVKLPTGQSPVWLTQQLMAFLGQLDHGEKSFWVKDRSTPVWSGNVAYRTDLFSTGMRFDDRYNRSGKGVGGGSDGIMFRQLLEQAVRIRYRPDMVINHLVEDEKLKRSYFIRLHYVAGRKFGEYQMSTQKKSLFGVGPFMIRQLLVQTGKALVMLLRRDPDAVRQAMNASYAVGTLTGRFRSWKTG
jgi:glycosyltransferase involved in cell wall biosynthesis